MNRIRYFILLWLISSLSSIIFIIQRLIGLLSVSGGVAHGELVSLNTALISIVVNGIALYIGLYCAQKIGMRLLLLNENYDGKKDILYPATMIAIPYAILIFIVDKTMLAGFGGLFHISSYADLYHIIDWKLLPSIKYDLFILLFAMCGLAFILKKVMKNISLSWLIPISLGIISLLGEIVIVINVFRSPRVQFGLVSMYQNILFFGSVFGILTTLLIGTVFWKRGLETALLCHAMIIIILYGIAPAIFLWHMLRFNTL